jgi:peptide deformylase
MADLFPKELSFCYWGNPLLRKRCIPVENPGLPELIAFIKEMKSLLIAKNGLGLAANQVGCDRRVCLISFPKEDDYSEIKALVNPVIFEASKESIIAEEGCLSFPKLYEDVSRPKLIKVKAFIPGEGEVCFEASGILAREICHELDHLDGVVFIDRLSQLKRTLLKKELDRIMREGRENK